MRQRTHRFGVLAAVASGLAAALVFAGCAPALDWREWRAEGGGIAMMFPCRPDRRERMVRVGEATLPMQMVSCAAADATFSLVAADAADPAQVAPLLASLRRQAIANIGGSAAEQALPAIAGATPNPQSALLRIEGQRPDGRHVVAFTAFFVKGMRLYEATVLGGDGPAARDASHTFFTSIRLS